MSKFIKPFLCVYLCCFLPLVFAVSEREASQVKRENQQVVVTLSDAKLTITAINEGTVEVFYEPHNTVQLPSFALPDDHSVFTDGELKPVENGYQYVLPDLTVNIQMRPFVLSFANQSGLLATEEVGLFNYQTTRGFRFRLQDSEKIMGGGQRVLGMDRRGHRMPLYNKASYGYNGQTNQMYYGLPAVMSDKSYAIAFDNSANGFLDIGHTEKDILQFEADAGRTSYLFSAGKDYYELIENFVGASGTQPMPPRWALGNYASRFGYKTQQQVIDTINGFVEADFPVDAVVIDLYWFGADIKGHMGNLVWDSEHWPEPEKMIDTLAEQGVKTILITEPFILSSSKQWQSAVENQALAKNLAGEPRRFDFYFGNTGLVDVFDENARDWFWQFYEKLNQQGVAGWWGDLGEPEVHPADSLHNLNGQTVTANEIHNVYGHRWAQMVFEKQRQTRPNERPFIMMRSGFVGSQRYGMVPWTGDVDRSWGGLQPQVELALQMSMFGLAYTHSDLGGFAGGEVFDAELYTRWMQYGVFQPVYRPHAQDHIPPEPIFHDKATQDIVREYVKLRYRMLPYNYSLSMRNSMTGIPMMRPLFMDFPKQDLSRTDAYMWGGAFLVSPIVEKGKTAQSVLLPKGYWFNFWTDELYVGGNKQVINAPLHELPVLVKAGAFVPQVNDMQNTQAYSTEVLNVAYYHHKSVQEANYTMYDDDGKDPDALTKQQFQTIAFSSRMSDELHIQASLQGRFSSAPNKRLINMTIHGVDAKPKTVLVDGKAIAVSDDLSQLDADTAVYNKDTDQITIPGVLVKQLDIIIR